MIQGSWRALVWIGLSQLCALSLWYSASVIAPELIKVWNLNTNLESWLSASVPIGFVMGALFSSYFGIADRFNPRKVFAISAFIGALLNALLIIVDSVFFWYSTKNINWNNPRWCIPNRCENFIRMVS